MFDKIKVLGGALALSLSLSFGSGSAMAALPLEGVKLFVGVSIAPPFAYVSNSLSEPSGIDVDVIKELQRRTGFKLRDDAIDLMNFGELIDLAKKREFDIAGGGISLTEERSKIFDFTEPYTTMYTALVVREDSNIKTMNDLHNCSVAAEKGTVASDLIPQGSGINIRVDESPSNFMAFYRVSRGLSDALIVDEPLAQDYMHTWHNSNLKIAEVYRDSGVGVGLLLKKSSPYTVELQKAFHDMKADGTLDKILKKHTTDRYDH